MIAWASARLSGDFPAQSKYLETALEYSPGNNILLINLADSRTEMEDWEGAQRALQEPLAMRWPYPPLYPLAALCSIHLGRLDDAEELILETIAIDPLDAWARHELVLIARESGKPRVAQQRLDELHSMMRGEVQTYLDVALDYASAGLYEDTFPLVGFMTTDCTLYPIVAYILGAIPITNLRWRERTELFSTFPLENHIDQPLPVHRQVKLQKPK